MGYEASAVPRPRLPHNVPRSRVRAVPPGRQECYGAFVCGDLPRTLFATHLARAQEKRKAGLGVGVQDTGIDRRKVAVFCNSVRSFLIFYRDITIFGYASVTTSSPRRISLEKATLNDVDQRGPAFRSNTFVAGHQAISGNLREELARDHLS